MLVFFLIFVAYFVDMNVCKHLLINTYIYTYVHSTEPRVYLGIVFTHVTVNLG